MTSKHNTDGTSSAEDFAAFLAWLDPHPDRAAEKYKDIQKRLTRMFDYRGCEQPEELADETITRVMRKAPELAETYEGDPVRYFYGVARNVARQHFATRSAARARGPGGPEYAAPVAEDLERQHACLDHCLETTLSPEERSLILEYYRHEGRGGHVARRQQLARAADIAPDTLRKRTERIRRRLQDCLLRCLKGDH